MIAAERGALGEPEAATRRAILARVRGVEVETIEEGRYLGPCDQEVDSAIDRRQAVHEEELLAADKVGREILKLRIERERLLDVVWLAASSVQVRARWAKVS